jgi:hypothetical protein
MDRRGDRDTIGGGEHVEPTQSRDLVNLLENSTHHLRKADRISGCARSAQILARPRVLSHLARSDLARCHRDNRTELER